MESRCNSESPECTCPCNCGCQNDPNGMDLPFDEKGFCASCAKGNHEVPPDGVRPTLDELIAAHESILTQLRQVREERKNVAHV